MFYLYLRAALGSSYHNFAELFFGFQTFRKSYRIGEFGSWRGRFCSKFSSWHNNALLLNSLDYLRNSYPHLSQEIGFNPYPHGIITGTENIYSADTFYASQNILDIDQGIVSEKILVIPPIFRGEGDQHKNIRK